MKNWTIQDYSHFIWMTFIENEDIETEVSEIELETKGVNYILLRHNPIFKRKRKEREYWQDKLGKEYHYGNTVRNYAKITPNTKTFLFYTDKDEIYFWGCGNVGVVQKEGDDKFRTTMKDFVFFDKTFEPGENSAEPLAVKASASVQKEIKDYRWNRFNSINEINEQISN